MVIISSSISISTAIDFWAKFQVHELSNKGFLLSNQYIERIPVVKINMQTLKEFDNLVRDKNIQEIEKLIYKIYGITQDEKNFIETFLEPNQ